jgi:hypothetical protein
MPREGDLIQRLRVRDAGKHQSRDADLTSGQTDLTSDQTGLTIGQTGLTSGQTDLTSGHQSRDAVDRAGRRVRSSAGQNDWSSEGGIPLSQGFSPPLAACRNRPV